MGTRRRWIDLDEIKEWRDNPNEGDVGAIYNSVKRWGYWGSMCLWKDNQNMGGNHSLRALKLLRKEGWTPRGDGLRVVDGCWQVLYWDIASMPKEEAVAFALALNRTSRLGHDDPRQLLAMLNSISSDDAKLSAGYDQDDIDDLLWLVLQERPAAGDGQSEENEQHPIVCPACGHEFTLEEIKL